MKNLKDLRESGMMKPGVLVCVVRDWGNRLEITQQDRLLCEFMIVSADELGIRIRTIWSNQAYAPFPVGYYRRLGKDLDLNKALGRKMRLVVTADLSEQPDMRKWPAELAAKVTGRKELFVASRLKQPSLTKKLKPRGAGTTASKRRTRRERLKKLKSVPAIWGSIPNYKGLVISTRLLTEHSFRIINEPCKISRNMLRDFPFYVVVESGFIRQSTYNEKMVVFSKSLSYKNYRCDGVDALNDKRIRYHVVALKERMDSIRHGMRDRRKFCRYYIEGLLKEEKRPSTIRQAIPSRYNRLINAPEPPQAPIAFGRGAETAVPSPVAWEVRYEDEDLDEDDTAEY